MFENIPREMRVHRQWLNWSYAEIDGKITKPPLNPHNGTLASVVEPAHASTYDHVLRNVTDRRCTGIGFVLTPADPYTIIDLDGKDMTPEKIAFFENIIKEFDSYTEISPSGNGVHIIVYGHLPRGIKRKGVEIYSRDRYMTMTGNVVVNKPIKHAQFKLETLFREIGGYDDDVSTGVADKEQTVTDEQLIELCAKGATGDDFRSLWAGSFLHHPSQSEADQHLMNLIAFYTDNRAQCIRVFRTSALGKRDKANRDDYMRWTVNKAFDQKLDTEFLRDALKRTQAIVAAPPEPTAVAPGDTPVVAPPGLLGDLMRYVLAASPRPVPQVALAAALGYMAAAGRVWNVSGTGLNIYAMVVAPSGSGKEMVRSGVDLIAKVASEHTPQNLALPAGPASLIGPSELASGQGVIRQFSNGKKSFVSVIGEFGLRLKAMASPRASSHELQLMRTLLDLYALSGKNKRLNSTAYSDSAKDTAILYAPSFTVIAETTPETLFKGLDEAVITNGLFPRFLTLQYTGGRPSPNRFHEQAQFENTAHLVAFTQFALSKLATDQVVDVEFTPDADAYAMEISEHYDAEMRKDNREVSLNLWNRGHLKVLKLAALASVGIAHERPVITVPALDWARTIVEADIRRMVAQFDAGEFEGDDSDNRRVAVFAQKVLAILADRKAAGNVNFERIIAAGAIPVSVIQQRCYNMASFKKAKLGVNRAFDDVLKMMVKRGVLLEANKAILQTSAECVTVADIEMLQKWAGK